MQALQTALPDGARLELRPLSEGFGSLAVETSSGLVVLVAKNRIGVQARVKSLRLLPGLAPHLPIAVPVPCWHVESAPGLPNGALAYRKLPGSALVDQAAARYSKELPAEIATFLSALHAFPAEQAQALGLTRFEAFRNTLSALRSEVTEALRAILEFNEYRQVQRWWDEFLSDRVLETNCQVVGHGDFWPENLLVDNEARHLVGVIDFGDAAIVDPAFDLAPLYQRGPAFANACVEAYGQRAGELGDNFRYRLQRYWELRAGGFVGLRAAIHEHDDGEIEASIGKLRRSPILVR